MGDIIESNLSRIPPNPLCYHYWNNCVTEK